jgi:hypothetical protein
MKLKNILGGSAFWMVNKSLAKHLGCIESALLLAYLIDKGDYHSTRGESVLFEDEYYFFATSESIEQATTLSYRKQKKCLKTLQNAGFIDQVLIGVPAKLHFTIRENKILQFATSSISETQKLDSTKREDILRKEDKEKKQKKEEGNSPSPISFFETKQAITKHLNKAIKKKEWLELTDGLDKDVPTIIEEVADAWIGKDRPFNPKSISNQKGIVTFARSWCENLPRHIVKQSENKETIISEKSLNNNPDAIYEFIETTRNRKMPEGEKDYCRPIVENLLKKGVLRMDKFQDEYPEMIKHIPKAKNLTALFEGYERFVTYI